MNIIYLVTKYRVGMVDEPIMTAYSDRNDAEKCAKMLDKQYHDDDSTLPAKIKVVNYIDRNEGNQDEH